MCGRRIMATPAPLQKVSCHVIHLWATDMGIRPRPDCLIKWLAAHTCAGLRKVYTEHKCRASAGICRETEQRAPQTARLSKLATRCESKECIWHVIMGSITATCSCLARSSSQTHLSCSQELRIRLKLAVPRVCQQRHQLHTVSKRHQPICRPQLQAHVGNR